MTQRGLYVVFEGIDGSGKSAVMGQVAQAVADLLPRVIKTRHPGATPLGAHIRKLVKFPHEIGPDIEIDELSRQLLYITDAACFTRTRLIPAMDSGVSVFADRNSFLSCLVYGVAEGLTYSQISKLFGLIEAPRADRVYVLRCPWELGRQRASGRQLEGSSDHFDNQTAETMQKIQSAYDHLITGPQDRTILVNRAVALDDVIFVDASDRLDNVVRTVVSDLRTVISERI